MSDAGRRTILGAIRHHLEMSRRTETLPPGWDRLPPPEPCRGDRVGRRPAGDAEFVDRFAERLESVGGHVHRSAGQDEARARVASILADVDAGRVVWTATARAMLEIRAEPADSHDQERGRLLAAEAGVTTAQWGVAETGSVVLDSSVERHRLASLVPPLHVVILPRARLVGTMADALRAIHCAGPAPCVTIITGPSRTADIELQLVIGVHGPRAVHVVVVG